MSISTMKKLTAILPREDADALVRRLMRLRAVSLIERTDEELPPLLPDGQEDSAAKAAARAARVDAAIAPLVRYSDRKKGLFAHATQVSPEAFCADGRYENAWRIVEKTEEILKKKQELTARLAGEATEKQSYYPYLSFAYPLHFTGTETTGLILGSFPGSTARDTVLRALDGLAATVDFLPEATTGLYASVVYHRSEEGEVREALSSVGFLKATFPATGGTATALFDAAAARHAQTAQRLARTERALRSLAQNLTDLEILSDIEHTASLAEENKQRLLATGKCAVLTAWCPARLEARVTALLERFDAAFSFDDPEEGEEPPVLLRNGPYSRNFEWVLGMYSYPKYGRFDPTLVMSLFYFLVFGLMFADAGYGLMLVVACFGGVRLLKPREGMKRFLLMFGYCGISCIIFGVLFGSYFGNFPIAVMENMLHIPPEEMPYLGLLPATAPSVAVLFDPIQNPMAFLIISLGFGALHLIAGMAVKAFILCRDKKPLDALFDIGSYWLLFGGIGTVFFHKTVGIWLIAGGVLAIVLTQGRHNKKLPMKIAGGLLGLYNLINFASDLLSYSRILALGLAAGVIGQVVNILATMKGPSVLGFLMLILVFCIGHVLNLVINVLGTFVHASRLQYIEFFGRFYEDGGVPFVPLREADRYTDNTTPTAPESDPVPRRVSRKESLSAVELIVDTAVENEQ